MIYEETLKNLSNRCSTLKENIQTEEATKTSLIMPFFQLLGYDVFNPIEFVPEFTADVGIKKGEKVDYAILKDNLPIILIEAKSVKEELNKHDSQLFRYFGTTEAKFAILTNGINYKFYTDLDSPNVMDKTPFLEINMLELKEHHIQELKKFHKDNFDTSRILDTASELKYTEIIRNVLKELFNSPTDDFVKLVLNSGVFEGIKTSAILEKFKPLIKKSISLHFNELMNDRLQAAIKGNHDDLTPTEEAETSDINNDEKDEIVTTAEELETYYIVKSILRNYINSNRISYKDTLSYFGILIDGKVTKWICRVYLKDNVKYIIVLDNLGTPQKYIINDIDDIYELKEHLIARATSLI